MRQTFDEQKAKFIEWQGRNDPFAAADEEAAFYGGWQACEASMREEITSLRNALLVLSEEAHIDHNGSGLHFSIRKGYDDCPRHIFEDCISRKCITARKLAEGAVYATDADAQRTIDLLVAEKVLKTMETIKAAWNTQGYGPNHSFTLWLTQLLAYDRAAVEKLQGKAECQT